MPNEATLRAIRELDGRNASTASSLAPQFAALLAAIDAEVEAARREERKACELACLLIVKLAQECMSGLARGDDHAK